VGRGSEDKSEVMSTRFDREDCRQDDATHPTDHMSIAEV
jgi:hypothetical protein